MHASGQHKTSGRAMAALLFLMVWMVFLAKFSAAEANGPGANAPLEASQILRLSIESAQLGRKVPFLVYLPKGYGDGKPYPVWYGLHSYSTSETMWLDASAGKMADEKIARGEMRPMIMVFPRTRYDSAKEIREDLMDGKRGESGMGRFLTGELIPYVNSHFDTEQSSEGRYIGGFSMGGYFALEIAFRHPDLFSRVGAFGPALPDSDFSGGQFEKWLCPDTSSDANSDTSSEASSEASTDAGPNSGPDANSDVSSDASPNASPEAAADAPRFAKTRGLNRLWVYLDCGSENDPFSEGAESLSHALSDRDIPVVFSMHSGGHSLNANRIGEYLLFFGGDPTPSQQSGQ